MILRAEGMLRLMEAKLVLGHYLSEMQIFIIRIIQLLNMINCKDRFLPMLHKAPLEHSFYQSSSNSTAEIWHALQLFFYKVSL